MPYAPCGLPVQNWPEFKFFLKLINRSTELLPGGYNGSWYCYWYYNVLPNIRYTHVLLLVVPVVPGVLLDYSSIEPPRGILFAKFCDQPHLTSATRFANDLFGNH